MSTKTHDLKSVSIDRIDSTRGHVRGNVQLVCVGANNLKRHYTNRAAIDFVQDWIDELTIVDFEFDQLILRVIDPDLYVDFYAKYHYLGRGGRRGYTLGAFIGEELAACATIGVITRMEMAEKQGLPSEAVRELARFCIHPKYQKKNFGTWFLSRAVKQFSAEYPDVKLLISFADTTRGHDGTLYKAAGWTYDGDTAPSYHYEDKQGNVIHKKTVFDNARSVGLTEKVYAQALSRVAHKAKRRFLLSL